MPEAKTFSFDKIITYPIAKKLSTILHIIPWMSPNLISISRIIPAFLTCFHYYHNNYNIAKYTLLITIFMDHLDGAYARKYNMTSKLGRKVDMYSDIFCSSIIIGTVFYKKKIAHVGIPLVVFSLFFFNGLIIKVKTPKCVKILQPIIVDNVLLIYILLLLYDAKKARLRRITQEKPDYGV